MQIILLLFAICLALWARKSRSAIDQQGESLNQAQLASSSPAKLKVASYNIQTGKDINGKRNLQQSAHVLRNVDLAGVQEVYAPTLLNLLGIGSGQAPRLAAAGTFAWLFCPTRLRWLREHRGNLILSKLPIERWSIKMLPDQSGKSFRNMTVAEVSWQGQKFHFINTHLHTRQGREQQLDIVLQEFAKHPRAILVGDFNTRADSPALANALRDIDVVDAIQAAGLDIDNPDRIDWILCRGFEVHEGHMLEKGVSDHPFYQVTLSIK